MNCPIGEEKCEGCSCQKEGLCDFPYHNDYTREETSEVTENYLARMKDRGGR